MYQNHPVIALMKVAKRLRKRPEHPDLKVLSAYAESYYKSDDFYFSSFAPIVKRTELPLNQVRVISRRLTRNGYLKFGKGLWSIDGEMAGAGYALTPIGHALLTLSKEG